MVPLTALWVPILLSGVIVWVASFIIHVVLPFHRKDYRKVPAEDDVMAALRPFNIPPGDYVLPLLQPPARMDSPEYLEKVNKGPVVIMTVLPSGPPNMGATLGLWFVYCVVVSLLAAYVAGRALGPTAEYLDVFRFAGTAAFLAYSVGLWQNSIWFKKSWGTTLRSNIDGLIYGMLTAGVFGWLWPRG